MSESSYTYPTKICSNTECVNNGVELPLKDFHKCKGTKDGLKKICKSCVREYNKEYHKKNKNKVSHQRAIYRLNNRDLILSQEKIYYKSNATFKRFGHLLTRSDYPQEGSDGYLLVRCKLCETLFNPTNQEANNRYRSVIGKNPGEHNFYCSDKCKKGCGTFAKKLYPYNHPYHNKPDTRELQGPWAKKVKERDEYVCQRCGKGEESILHAHHIEPLNVTYDAWLVENGITFCADCHMNYAHQLKGCTLKEIKNNC